MEAWLNHTDVLSSSLLVSGMNNLILAKEHILQWKPHLVIADLYGFLNDALPEQPINAFKEIAYALGIHGKTVYTYKRNIRMKLHMDNRYSPFLMLPEKID